MANNWQPHCSVLIASDRHGRSITAFSLVTWREGLLCAAALADCSRPAGVVSMALPTVKVLWFLPHVTLKCVPA